MSRRSALVIGVIAAIVMVIGIVGALSSRDGGDDQAAPKPPPGPENTSFNAVGLPPVHIARCPTGGELLPQPPAGEDTLPDLTLECLGEIGSTETLSLRRLGGVPTVVNLWASWCDPCKREMPDLQRVAAAAGARVRFVGVNTGDSAEGARATLNNTKAAYAEVADPKSKVREGLGAFGMPVTAFVGADGRVLHVKSGPMTEAELRALIAEHLRVQL